MTEKALHYDLTKNVGVANGGQVAHAVAHPWVPGHIKDIRMTTITAGSNVTPIIWAVPFGMINSTLLLFPQLI
jgi:hypothetical protein